MYVSVPDPSSGLPSASGLLGPSHLVILLHGLPGAGKTTLARRISETMNCEVIHFDDYWAKSGRSPSSCTENQRFNLYQQGIDDALLASLRGNVVIDCTSRSAFFRHWAVQLLSAHGGRVVILSCSVPNHVARMRVGARWILERNHLGKGTKHFDRLSPTFEPIGADEAAPVLSVDTSCRYSTRFDVISTAIMDVSWCAEVISALTYEPRRFNVITAFLRSTLDGLITGMSFVAGRVLESLGRCCQSKSASHTRE